MRCCLVLALLAACSGGSWLHDARVLVDGVHAVASDCRTQVCVRLDGPVAFFDQARLFVVARKHLIEPESRKRTALYELTGDLDGGDLSVVERGELPSAGDTAYAGVAPIGRNRFLVTWYSSELAPDPSWLLAALGPTDIWQATLDLSRR